MRLARIVELTENNNYSFQAEAESAAGTELRSGTINHAPLVTDQALEGAEDTTISGRILATDVEKGVLIYEVEQGPTSGTLQLDRATGQFIYTPTADYNGPDSFVVTVIDDHGNRTSSRIDLTITPVNDAPVSSDQNLTTLEDTPVDGQVVATDIENDTLSYVVSSPAANGTVSLDAATGVFTYIPNADYNGSDSFIVTIDDGQGGTTTSKITIGVIPVNDAPVSSDQNLTTPEDTPLDGQINASDIDKDVLSYSISSPVTHGTVSLNPATGAFTYTPNADYNGSDRFVVTIDDGQGGTTTSTVNIGVTPVNDAPVSADQNLTTPEDTSLAGQVVARDVDGDTLSYNLSTPVTHGTLILNATTGVFTYTPNANYNGSDRFVVTIDDGQGGTTTSTINIGVTPVNDAPVSADQNLITPEDVPINGQVVASDVDGDALNYRVTTTAANGTVSLNATTGAFVYSPNANFNGSDRFVITVSDGNGGVTSSTINIGVTPVNDDPVANNLSLTTPEDTAVSGAISASDVDGDSLTYNVIGAGPSNGSLSFNSSTGGFVYTPNHTYTGSDSFQVRVSDGQGGSTTSTVSIGVTPVSDPVVNSITSPSAIEGADLSYSVTLSRATTNSISLPYSLGGGSASAADYGTPTFSNGVTLVGGNLIIPVGVASFSVTVPTVDDVLSESTETLPLIIGGVTGTGSITDNDGTPSLSINSISVNEGAGTATFTVTLSAASGQTVSVNYASSNGTATAGSDYTAVTGTLNFAAGDLTKTITVPITDDSLAEGPENFSITLSTPSNATLGTAVGTGTIVDNDGAPSLSIDNVSVNEGAGTATFTVTLSAVSAQAISVDYVSSNGTATAGSDYTAVNGTLNFAAGDLTKIITVPITDDGIFEVSENFSINLTNPTNAILGTATGTGTIVDDDPAPKITGMSVQHATEGANLVCTVTLDQVLGAPFTLPHSIGGGTASLADYGTPIYSNGVTVVGTNLLIPAGVSSFSITLPTVDDSLNEPTETVPFTFGALTIAGNIYDNDTEPSLSINNISVNEGAGTATFTVTLSAASGQAVTVNYASSNGTATAGSDYTAVNGTLNFAAGDLTKTITVPIADDSLFEGNENFTITLSGATNASIATATGTGTIVDNDSAPAVSSISSPTVVEGADLVYNIALSNASTTTTTLAYTLGGGSASAADYGTPTFSNGVTLVGSNLLIPAGVTSFSVTVPTVDDVLSEPTETLPLIIGGVTGTGSITDNDGAPSLSINNISVNEGAGTATFTVTLSAASGQAVTVNYASSNGTATAGSDYTAVSGTLNFAAGDLTKTITVPISDDSLFEGNENFTITLSGATNASIATATGTGTIVDNDSAPTVSSISSPTVVEGADLVYNIALSNASTTTTTLAYTLGGGSASAADYGTPTFSNGVTLVGSNLLIPAGVTTFSVTVPTVDDVLSEPTETLPLIIGGVTGTGSITDNDGAPSLSINNISVNEGAGTATFTVTLSAASGQAVSVNYASSNGTATAGSDYTAVSGTLNFAAGQTIKTITVPIIDDTIFEGPENFTITLSSATNASIATATGTGTIIDNDLDPSNNAPKAFNDPLVTPYNINLGNTSTDFWGGLVTKGVNLAFYKADGTVGTMFERTSDHAIGVATSPRTVTFQVPEQIEYDQTTGKSESIVMSFTKGALTQATFSVSNLFPGENGGEMGAWEVSYQGVIIAANTFRLTGTSDKGTFTIDTGGRVFDSVKFTALNTNNGTGDGGDYYITNFVGSGPGTTTGSYLVNEGGTSVVGSTSSARLLANDTDADGDTLKVTHINGNPIIDGQSISLPSGATLVIHTDGSFSYATNNAYDYLNAGQLATNSFTYSISDGRGGVDTATATMTIVGAGPALSTTGTSGNDTIIGTSGADLIIGGPGNDTLTGALGADTFKWSLADKGAVGAPARDTVIDFSNAQGDVLHLSELLQGENSGNLTNYLHFTYNATANSTTINISSSGAYGTSGYSAALTDQIIVLNGYSTSGSDTDIINQLKAAGRLITD